MQIDGTLTKWNDERGFGFITPRRGGQNIFVHISEFTRNGRRPQLGEVLLFEIETDKEGKKRAVKVSHPGQTKAARSRQSRLANPRKGHRLVGPLCTLVILVAIGGYGYIEYSGRANIRSIVGTNKSTEAVAQPSIEDSTDSFQCDGRTYCSQMTSCAEAKFFLRNCPNVKMDGNHDGIPCEKQRCTSFFGN